MPKLIIMDMEFSIFNLKYGWINSLKAIALVALVLSGSSATRADPLRSEVVVINTGSLQGASGYRIEGQQYGDRAGSALGNAGDVNGDGLDDFIIGAASASSDGKQGAGEAYVVFGNPSNPLSLPLNNLHGSNGFRISGANFNDEVGSSVQGGGDVNNDGYADLLIGAPGAEPNDQVTKAGAVFVVFGRPSFPANFDLSTLNGVNGFRINGIAENNRVGTSVSNAADVNGDGYDDILIGAPDTSSGGKEGVGQAYVVFGKSDFAPTLELKSLDGTNGFQVLGNTADSYVGRVVSSAGDLNGDGFGDILLTAWKYMAAKSLESGTVFVIFGQPSFPAKFNLTGINGVNGFRIEGETTGDNSGRSAAPAGDVNGDGRDDLIIGAPYAAKHKGHAYVVFGQPTFATVFNLDGLNGANGFRMIGSEANGEAGTAVAAADVNGDGLDDVIIGASLAGINSGRFAGKTYIVLGRPSFQPAITLHSSTDFDGIVFEGAASGDQIGQTLSLAGDVNGDGFDEFLIGAPNAGPQVNSDVGYIYLVSGGSTLGITLPVTHPGTTSADILNGTSSSDIMLGGRGNDQIYALAGDDVLKGGSGDDFLAGSSGIDRLIGGNGHDTASYAGSTTGVSINLFTGATSEGDANKDFIRSIERIIGSPAADTLVGNPRRNVLEGAGENDNLTGGAGNDSFRYAPQSGNDTITDFIPGQASDDHLDFSNYLAIKGVGNLTIQARGSDTIITLPGGETITLLNVSPNTLHTDDYRFAGAPLAVPDSYSTPVNTSLMVTAPGVLGNDENPIATQLTATLVDTPLHGTLSLQSSGAFTYTPASNFVGVDEFTYKANNGQVSNVTRVTIDITLTPPTAVADTYIVVIGSTLSVPAPGVLGNDESAGGPALEAILIDEPVDGTLQLNPNGSFTYTPAIDYSAQVSFTYQASNGLASNTATVTINILDPDGPPVAADDLYELVVGSTLSMNPPGVLGNDVNPLPGPMTAKLSSNPANGALDLNPDGSFTYTPKSGFVGQDSFTYVADNGQPSSVATVTLVVKTTSGANFRLYTPVILRR